jgi:hypothetical protein
MIVINGHEYKLLLADTNVLINVSNSSFYGFRNLMTWTNFENFIICFSPFSLLEIRKSPNRYQQFLELFSDFPCAVLKSHEQLLADEVSAYPNPKNIMPILVGAPGRMVSGNSIGDILNAAFTEKQTLSDEERWLLDRDEIVNGIKSLVKNFPPETEKYSNKQIREFILLAGFQQIAMRQHVFAKAIVDSGCAVEIDAFPSVKMMTYVVFYKFYADSLRKVLTSDAFDLLIFSAIPYVDAIISESHIVDVMRKIRNQDRFIENIAGYTLSQIR